MHSFPRERRIWLILMVTLATLLLPPSTEAEVSEDGVWVDANESSIVATGTRDIITESLSGAFLGPSFPETLACHCAA